MAAHAFGEKANSEGLMLRIDVQGLTTTELRDILDCVWVERIQKENVFESATFVASDCESKVSQPNHCSAVKY